jgi:hypothetical protein
MAKERLTYNTPEVQAILDRVVRGGAIARSGSTEYWNAQLGDIPEAGEIIIYTDGRTKEVDGETVAIPAIKIGSGNAYVQDLAFADADLSDALAAHIQDGNVHVTLAEKAGWNNKLNVTDAQEVVGEALIFNRL